MKALKDVELKIKAKEEEIQKLQLQIEKSRAYVDGLREFLLAFTKGTSDSGTITIRPGSMVEHAVIALQKAQKPLHVVELLKGMGEEVSKSKRISLSGSLGSYVRKGQVFTRPAPNTFGLVEFESVKKGKDE